MAKGSFSNGTETSYEVQCSLLCNNQAKKETWQWYRN